MSAIRVLFVLIIASSGFAQAEAPSASSRVLGLPDMTCAAWSKTRSDSESRQPYIDWARGFLSGHNYGQPGSAVSVVSNGTIASFVDRHCVEKSASSVDVALMRMSDQYSGRNAPIRR